MIITNLEARLSNAIHNYIMETGGHPGAILIHPRDFMEIVESQRYPEYAYSNHRNNFQGIHIYRTLDIPEGEFRLI